MAKPHSQFSIFNFQLIILLFVAGCHTAPDTLPPAHIFSPVGLAPLDSLLQRAAAAPQDTALARLYYEIGDRFEDVDAERSKTFYLNAENLSDRLGWREGVYLSSYAFGNLLIREAKPDAALVVFQKGYDLSASENNETWKANMSFAKGNACYINHSFEQALTAYLEALAIYERTNNCKQLQSLYYMMTQVYTYLNKIDQAIETGEKAIAMNSENPYSFLCLALAYQAALQREKSVNHYQEALRLATLQNNFYLTGTIYVYLANEALSVFDLERAETYARQALEITRKFGLVTYQGNLILISKIEELKGNREQSEAYDKQVQQLAAELNVTDEKRLAYMMLSEITAMHRTYRNISQYYVKFDIFDFQMLSEPTLRAAEDMLQKYEISQKEREIEQHKQIIALQNRQRWLFGAVIAFCVVGLVLLWYMFRLRTRHATVLTERNTALTERNDALAEINLTKDKFFSIISHDLKNPSIAQRDAIRTLIAHASQWNAAVLQDYYGELLRTADHQVELLYNLLGWAQLQTGRLTCQREMFDLLPEIRSDLALARKMADEKGVNLNTEIPQKAVVTADASMIPAVVRNLLTNAVKFTPAGGTVTLNISPCCRDVACHVSTNNGYTISVTDTGIGMSADELQNLFRLDRPHHRRGTSGETGTGLGLIVCRELLELHGSTLRVESEECKGTRFWFEI